MKKVSFYVMTAVSLFMLSGCAQKDQLPENPKDKQEYVDSKGHHWIYDYALLRWAMMPSGGYSTTPTYYYYPRTNSWTDHSGKSISQPKSVSVKPNSATRSTGSGKPRPSKSSFGSHSKSSVS